MGSPRCLCVPSPNKPERTAVAKQRFGKHVPAAKNRRAVIEELLEEVFSMRSMSYQILNR
jgi:hypothetical protein